MRRSSSFVLLRITSSALSLLIGKERLEIGSLHFPLLRLLSLYCAKNGISADVYIWNVSIDENLHGFLIERRALSVLNLFALTVLQLYNFFSLICALRCFWELPSALFRLLWERGMPVGDTVISLPFLLLLLLSFMVFIVNRRLWTGIEVFHNNTLYVSATSILEMHMKNF